MPEDERLYAVYCDFTDGSRMSNDGLTISDLVAIVGTFDNLSITECWIEPSPPSWQVAP